MQSPDRRRVYAEMNVRRAGLLADREILIDVPKADDSSELLVLGA